jgi:hypothetical protein
MPKSTPTRRRNKKIEKARVAFFSLIIISKIEKYMKWWIDQPCMLTCTTYFTLMYSFDIWGKASPLLPYIHK